jgi:3-methyladenine DNA glycosylase AlkD
MTARSTRRSGSTQRAEGPDIDERVSGVLAELKKRSTKKTLDGMARYAIPSRDAYGVAMKDIKSFGKSLGTDHPLAVALWETGVYEARMLVSFIADPDRLTAAQMDRWCRDFDNWGYCDTLSFNLFDRSPHAWPMVMKWSKRKPEFEKRTAFALLWSLSVHDKSAADRQFIDGLALIEREASDDRNFVKKAVNMALRAIGKRNRALNVAATEVARRLAASANPTAKWVGKDALRELTSASVMKRLKA